jgi:hypothetical protein
MESSTEFEKSRQYGAQALTVKQQAEALTIVDQTSYNVAAEAFKAASALENEIVAHHAPMKKAAHEAHKTICDQEKRLLVPIQEGKQIISRLIGSWEAEQRRKEEAERARLEAEERRRNEEAALAEATAALEDGASQEEAMAILEAPQATPRIAPAPAYQRASGLRTNTYYSAEVTSLELLVKAAAQNKLYLAYLQPNLAAINAMARAQKEVFALPGCKLKKETKAGASGR